MRITKKLLCGLLAVVLCLGLTVPAMAVYPETWGEAKQYIGVESSLSGYDNYVEQEYELYHEEKNWSTGDIVEISDNFHGVGYTVLPSDGFVKVSNASTEMDNYIDIILRVFEKEHESKYVERWERYAPRGFDLRKRGFQPRMVGPQIDETYEYVRLYAGESKTITVADLFDAVGYGDNLDVDPNMEYLFYLDIQLNYPDEGETGMYYHGTWCYVVDDEAAAEILNKGKLNSDPGNPFTDVPKDAYYHDPVLWALEKNITTGTSKTTFSPTATCTRGQVATFLWRAKGCPEPKTTENPFVDVKETDYYYKAILWAYENGITNGTSKTKFDPAGTCTSAHVVTFLWRANGKPAVAHTGTEYYAEAVAWANENGLLAGTDMAFAPNNLSPRADIVTYLYRDMAE